MPSLNIIVRPCWASKYALVADRTYRVVHPGLFDILKQGGQLICGRILGSQVMKKGGDPVRRHEWKRQDSSYEFEGSVICGVGGL